MYLIWWFHYLFTAQTTFEPLRRPSDDYSDSDVKESDSEIYSVGSLMETSPPQFSVDNVAFICYRYPSSERRLCALGAEVKTWRVWSCIEYIVDGKVSGFQSATTSSTRKQVCESMNKGTRPIDSYDAEKVSDIVSLPGTWARYSLYNARWSNISNGEEQTMTRTWKRDGIFSCNWFWGSRHVNGKITARLDIYSILSPSKNCSGEMHLTWRHTQPGLWSVSSTTLRWSRCRLWSMCDKIGCF